MDPSPPLSCSQHSRAFTFLLWPMENSACMGVDLLPAQPRWTNVWPENLVQGVAIRCWVGSYFTLRLRFQLNLEELRLCTDCISLVKV